MIKVSDSFIVMVLLMSSGASFVPVIATSTSCVSVAPLVSVTVTVKFSVAVCPAANDCANALSMVYVH